MPVQGTFAKLIEIPRRFLDQPKLSLKLLSQLPYMTRGFSYPQSWETSTAECATPSEYSTADVFSNPLKDFFDAQETGRGIWKWIHYFEIYQRHFSKFVGKSVNVLEVGIYSGGSLDMWRHYFGSGCHVYGVDIEKDCKCYENEYTEIFIGDQANRNFWKTLKQQLPAVDILIDDGGHQVEQQIITLEEMLPHLRPGGIYLCEDIHGELNSFSAYAQGLSKNLNAYRGGHATSGVRPTEFQSWINSVHFYPYVTVIEKVDSSVQQFIAPKRGTEWQPFL